VGVSVGTVCAVWYVAHRIAVGRRKRARVVVDATHKHKQLQDLVVREVKDIPDEVPGDVFDRQRVMRGFSQSKIEEQVCFVLGVGGLGSSIALALVRMGVQRVILLDCDEVDASNLNRQSLFGVHEVGNRKVVAAKKVLNQYHNLRTEIDVMDVDAVTHWGEVVAAAQGCTVVFNNIDYGACFDSAVNSLCKALGIPYVAGSTYANTMEITYYGGAPGDVCWCCANSITECFSYKPDEVKAYAPLTEASIQRVLRKLLRIHGEQTDWLITQVMAETGFTEYSPEDFCKVFLPRLRDIIEQKLLPDRVGTSVDDMSCFIAKTKPLETRMVGSWIGVCMAGSLMLVNLWMQNLMHDPEEAPCFNWSKVDLGLYEGGIASFGFVTEQDQECATCAAMKTQETS
jgi:molybdopterin/thiamine biosynthesis adenylyltransferase